MTGTALAAWATAEAGDVDLELPDRVVTCGPYAISRHPMYVAWTLGFVGVGLVVGTRWMVMLVAPLAALVHRAARIEEDRLTAALGAQYTAYQGRVRRYV